VIIINKYAGLNLKELQLLGQGTQGKVYKIDSAKCIKIFKSKLVCNNEFETLMMAQIDNHFPRLYSAGEDYIVRECINGIELNRYLSSSPLTPWISNKIINLYEAMGRVGYRRLDSAIFHIFMTPSGELKLIDTAKAIKKKTIYPRLILDGLDTLGYKEEFLDFVKCIRPDIYTKW
jgi:RIO-like serine/threonine protein kinase